MNENEAKKNIRKLINKYQDAVKNNGLDKYSEEETKKDFILPLFEILGWSVFDKNEVSAEESQTSGKRVDYGFYIDNRPKFFLETKKFKANIHDEEFAKQAIRYSWNKGVTWAVLTNFETLIVFNAQNIESRYLSDKRLFEIPCSEFVERFSQLWQLSRESFENDLIDKYAEQIGKKIQKVSVSAILYKDLDACRDILTNSISQCNPKVDKDLIDEGVQRLLDRLIFIRVAEDRKIEPPTLIPILREWENKSRSKIPVYQAMIKKFRKLDEIYDSNLFSKHTFENWEEYGGAMEKVIHILYGKEGYYEYDFKIMPADVLGGIYENYLGYRLSKSKKGLTLNKDAKKRKEEGIYYTPSFIVDYIVENALKPVLDQCKSINDLKKVKILDPACGSGSFLIKALEIISNKYKEFKNFNGIYSKLQIITENIYGVDLDIQAVEIARLNLLINALDKKEKLPILTNIKRGNSLISGTNEELKKYFGTNFREKEPFNWEEEFPEVFKQGGFDVIIGNPPYINVENLASDDRKYLMSNYKTATKRFDIFISFIEKGLNLLNPGGLLSFIIPYPFLNQNYAETIRKKMLTDFNLLHILDLSEIKIFGDAIVRNCIIIVQKPIGNKRNADVAIKKAINDKDAQQLDNLPVNLIPLSSFLKSPKSMFKLELNEKNTLLLEKIGRESINLGNICYVNWGARSGDVKKYVVKNPIDPLAKKMINARNIDRYQISYTDDYLIYKKNELYNPMFEELFESPKIIVRDISGRSRLKATFDNKKYYAEHTVSLAVPYFFLKDIKRRGLTINKELIDLSKKYDPKYLLANINSKLVNWFFISKLGGGLHVYPDDVKNLPIYKIDFSNKQERIVYSKLLDLVNKILNSNEELRHTVENSNKWHKVKSEIEKIDKEIDGEVYQLYGLTKKEIEIIENSNY